MNFVVQGWCPGALRPMMSGDGLVVRVRPRMARLTPKQVRGLATAALTHGNGVIDLTARANLQLRGIRPEAHLALLDDLNGLGLLDADEAVERHRNIVVSPFWTESDGTAKVAAAVEAVLCDPANATVSGKFGLAIDPARPVLRGVSADIRIERHGELWLVRPDGFNAGALVQDVTPALHRLLQWFTSTSAGRMADLAGQVLPMEFAAPMVGGDFAATLGQHDPGWLVAFEFGQMRAETLLALAHYPMRVTPWRMILLEGCTAAPTLAGVVTDPADPVLRVSACTGAPDCLQALQPTRALARQLAPSVPPGQHLHVSGCAKGCAHPKPADVTLTGTAAGFDLSRHGSAGEMPQSRFTTSTTLFKAL